MSTYCVIGSGISGATISNLLNKKHSVDLYDKARGPGGRSSFKRLDKKIGFDHGVQYISPKTSEFKKFTTKLIAKKILKTSIREGGSSIKNFNSVDGKSGNFQQNFFVYGREGMPCKSKNCNSIIKKIYISKRSSFLCPRCQK